MYHQVPQVMSVCCPDATCGSPVYLIRDIGTYGKLRMILIAMGWDDTVLSIAPNSKKWHTIE